LVILETSQETNHYDLPTTVRIFSDKLCSSAYDQMPPGEYKHYLCQCLIKANRSP